ncbi:DoxX-like family protein [Acidisphaera sp. L21]|uniref:DoxX-like family protein n=1 Tax=Acidisphaera sp. L21 TaxID=1641851 RepID=UPI00131BEB7C|nr:DoxX-like family protein [Acidisphaera sp. L21]
MQPIHVSDVARAVADLVASPSAPETLNLVGPEPMSTDELTACLRTWLGLPPRHPLAMSATLLRLGARLGEALPDAALTRDALRMLEAGNVADAAPAAAALGWAPRPLTTGLAADPACAADLLAARMVPVRGVLLACLAAVWAGTGVASLLVPAARADALLGGLGLSGELALAATRAGALLDLGLGLGLLPRRHRRFVLAVQLALMATYTALASVALPSLWLDPFGPLLKNLAILAATLALLTMEA